MRSRELGGRTADDDEVVEVIRKALPTMSEDGRRLALTLDLPAAAADLVARARAVGDRG